MCLSNGIYLGINYSFPCAHVWSAGRPTHHPQQSPLPFQYPPIISPFLLTPLPSTLLGYLPIHTIPMPFEFLSPSKSNQIKSIQSIAIPSLPFQPSPPPSPSLLQSESAPPTSPSLPFPFPFPPKFQSHSLPKPKLSLSLFLRNLHPSPSTHQRIYSYSYSCPLTLQTTPPLPPFRFPFPFPPPSAPTVHPSTSNFKPPKSYTCVHAAKKKKQNRDNHRTSLDSPADKARKSSSFPGKTPIAAARIPVPFPFPFPLSTFS